MQDSTSITISVIALLVSLITIYLQFFRVKGPAISLLNYGQHRTVPVPYGKLPTTIQEQFPEYNEKHPNYALARLILGNSGDRPGIVKITVSKIENPFISSKLEEEIKASYYNYAIIPPSSIVSQDILLRNIPLFG